MSLSLEKILILFLMCFYEIACNKAFSFYMVLMNEGLRLICGAIHDLQTVASSYMSSAPSPTTIGSMVER